MSGDTAMLSQDKNPRNVPLMFMFLHNSYEHQLPLKKLLNVVPYFKNSLHL